MVHIKILGFTIRLHVDLWVIWCTVRYFKMCIKTWNCTIGVLEPGGGIQILPPLSCHHVTYPLPPMSPCHFPAWWFFLPPLSCHRVTSLLPDKTLSKCRISCAPPLKTECFHSICRLCTAVNFCLLPRTTNSAFPATCQTEMFPSDGCTTVISHPWQHFETVAKIAKFSAQLWNAN